MLQQMRRLSKSWISSIFLGVLALSFGVWGIADIFRGNVDTSAFTVGGVKVPADLFQRDYRNFLKGESSQLGHDISMEEAHAKGLDKQGLQVAISRTAIDQLVDQYGLRATDAQVSSEIRAIPAFRGPLGAFDHQTFLYRIQNAGFTEDSFVAVERTDIARSQLLDAVHDDFALPEGYARLLFDYVNERRAADYVIVPKEAVGSPPAPSDAELSAYIAAHPQQFSTPEYREVTYAVAGPQDVMNQIHVTDQELQQQYELRKDQYQVPEKRSVEQIVFPDEASAKAASAKIDAGSNFDDVAKARGLNSSDISLGSVVQADLGTDRGPATFALAVNGTTQAIKSTFGWVLLHVTAITPGVNKTFAQVKDSLRKDVMNDLATAKLTDVTNAYDDASAGGASLADAAKKAGMRVVHIPAVDRSGLTPEGAKADLPATADFRQQLAKSDVGEEGDPFPSSDGNVYVIKVNGVTPPKLKPLSAVRAQATTAWTSDWEKQRLAAIGEQLVAQASAAKTLSGVAAKVHANVHSTGAMARNANVAGLPDVLVRKLFAARPDRVVSAFTASGDGLIIARVTGVAHPPPMLGNAMFMQFARTISGDAEPDFDAQLAMAVRDKLGVSVNQTQVDRVTGNS